MRWTRLAGGVPREDFAHDLRLGRIDFEAMADRIAAGVDAGDDRAVAVRQAARVIAALDLAGEPAMRLGAQVVEIGLADEAANAAQELSPRAGIGVVAIRYADDLDAAMLKPANHALLLDQVARQAIERFDQQYLESAGERLGHAGACSGAAVDRRGATNGAVGVYGDDCQSERVGALAADTSLILDRGDGLGVGAESGVDSGAHGTESSFGDRHASIGRPSRAACAARSASSETIGARFTAQVCRLRAGDRNVLRAARS
jgi:hypothetical protein